jgi:hypothetical protein
MWILVLYDWMYVCECLFSIYLEFKIFAIFSESTNLVS